MIGKVSIIVLDKTMKVWERNFNYINPYIYAYYCYPSDWINYAI